MSDQRTMPTAGDTPGRPAKPPCGHWDGPRQQYCGSTLSVRRYVIGHRCPDHTPSAVAGRPEPEPGPGWPIYRTQETQA